jgi:peroxiredoxin
MKFPRIVILPGMNTLTILPLALLSATLWGAHPAPDFSLKNASGAIVHLSDFKGKIVLLDFWATECGGCKTEIPWFMEFAHVYKARGVTVIGVSMDILYENLRDAAEGWGRVKPFVAAHGVNYPILMGDERVTAAYRIAALPLTLLIDRNGEIVSTHTAPPKGGEAEFRREIEALLK